MENSHEGLSNGVQIQLSAAQINHGFEVIIIPKTTSPAFDILNHAIHALKKCIRMAETEVINSTFPQGKSG